MPTHFGFMSVLASKALPDGTVLTAIHYGTKVLLLHQAVSNIEIRTIPLDIAISNLHRQWFGPDNGVHADVTMQSLRVRLITFEEYEAALDSYEQYVNQPEQIAPTLQLEDKR